MRRSTYLIFINAMVLVVIFASMAQSLFVVKRAATAAVVQGKVLVQHGGEGRFMPLAAGELIKSEDALKTGASGKAELEWADGTRLKILPHTDLVIRKSNYIMVKKADISRFELGTGTIYVSIAKPLSPQSKFEIETPTTIASVRGTTFMVEVKNGRTQVAVDKGAVKVSSGEGDAARECLIYPGRIATSSAFGEVQSGPETQVRADFTTPAFPLIKTIAVP